MNVVLVCGGRAYPDRAFVYKVLDELHGQTPITKIVTGDACHRDPDDPQNTKLWTGADWFANRWANDRGVPLAVYKADWDKHGRAAGPIRNQQMLDEEHPSLGVALPGGRGTDDMVGRLLRARVPVLKRPG